LAIFQQIIGINTIIYYAPTILTSIGYGESAAILVNAGLGLLTVVVTVVMLLMVDRVGRKLPLILGAVGMALCMAVLGMTFLSAGIEGGAAG
jgi:MFS family permease